MIEPVPSMIPLETSNVFTLLGIRFWDLVQAGQVRDGLVVKAWPEDYPAYATVATRTASGVYAFQGLQGMQSLEYPPLRPKPLGGLNPFEDPVEQKAFVVEAQDLQQRFLPLVFGVEVPFKGIFPADAMASPPLDSPLGCYLFSAPTRALVPGLASMRATLVEPADNPANPDKPAAHALVEVRVDGRTWYGIADDRGTVVVLFPYPNFTDPTALSSPGEPAQQEWEVRLRVRYEPDALRHFKGSETPTILSIFDQQPGSIWRTEAGPAVPELFFQLVYGEALVMRTDGRSSLRLSPAPSP